MFLFSLIYQPGIMLRERCDGGIKTISRELQAGLRARNFYGEIESTKERLIDR